jgi:hypothetical protein
MSLISDALKKARQEAARQDSLRQGVPYAVGSVDAPARRNPLLPLLAGLGAGCLAAGILFAVAYVAGWGPFSKPAQPAQEVRVAEAAAPPAAPQPSAIPTAEPLAPPPAVVRETAPPPFQAPPQESPPVAPAPEVPPQIEMRPSVSAEPPVAHPEPQATPSPAPAPVEEESPAPPAPVPAAPAPQAPAAPSESSGGLVDGKVYTGEVPVPGGGSVKLNGIAFSQDRPIAVLDGRVMGTGESIQGFTVVSIESGRVTLQGHGTTVFLAPK